MSWHGNQNKKREKWRYVYHKIDIRKRFNIEDTKLRSQIRMVEVKKAIYWEALELNLTFGKILNIWEDSQYVNSNIV